MKFQKYVNGFGHVFWSCGKFDIELHKDNEYKYQVHHKENGYCYYDGDFKKLSEAKKWIEKNFEVTK